IALGDEAGRRELPGAEAARGQVVRERVPALRREPDAEVLRGLGVEPALAEEPPADLGLGRAETLDEELLGGSVGGEEPGAVAVIDGLAAVFVVEFEADAPRESLHRLGERHVVNALQERVDVARLAASEAVVVAEL